MKYFSVITGASSGIGFEFAKQMATLFPLDEIWVVARRKEKLEELVELLGKERVKVYVYDLLHEKEINDLVKTMNQAKNDGLGLRYFVNNAGFGSYGTFLENDVSWSLSMIDLNIKAVVALSYAALNLMEKGSVLINTASLAAFQALGNFAVYAATKAFVLNFSLAIGAEVQERGIQVTALCPGPVETEFAEVASRGARTKVMHGKTTEIVVRHCLKKASKKHIVLHGIDWKFQAQIGRFITRFFAAKLTYKYMKRPVNHE